MLFSEQMETGDPVVCAPMAVAGAQSRSEDEESLGVKDMKRTATQAFGSGVPKRRSSSRFGLHYYMMRFSLCLVKCLFVFPLNLNKDVCVNTGTNVPCSFSVVHLQMFNWCVCSLGQ